MDDTECLICLDDFESSDVAILSCNHKYHYKCLTNWINKKKDKYNICSVCDKDVEILNIYNPKNDITINLIDNEENNNSDNRTKSDKILTKSKNKKKIYSCCTIL